MILYDDSFLETNDYQSVTIEDQTLVESTISTIDHSDQNPLSKNSITYFKDNKKIKKIVFNQYTKDNGYFKYEYYIKDNTPFLMKIESSESKSSDFIILDWFSHSIVFKNPTRIIYEFYYIKNLFEYVLKVINKYEEK